MTIINDFLDNYHKIKAVYKQYLLLKNQAFLDVDVV